MPNIVAIIGRPNVGKSTLFNRLIGSRTSIVDNLAGITRDRHYESVTWNQRTFTLIDTGGYTYQAPNQAISTKINDQINIAIKEASLLLFVLDCRTPLTNEDFSLADRLRKSEKPVLMVANKADNLTVSYNAHQFHRLGLGPTHEVSANQGSGTGDLLDAITAHFPPDETIENPTESIPKIAIIGTPNVGKSTLVNALLRKKRSVVHQTPHTTRTPVHSYYRFYKKELILIDTAGIAKKSQIKPQSIEFYSLIRSIKAIEQTDVCLLLIDATEGLTTQSKTILQLAHRKKKGLVLLVNKADLLENPSQTIVNYRKALQQELAFASYIPIIFTSGLEKKNIYQAIEKALAVYENSQQRIPTANLNKIIQKAINQLPPPAPKGKTLRFNYATQLPIKNPTIAIFCNLPQYIPTNYKRYLEKQLRLYTHFEGVPLTLIFKKK